MMFINESSLQKAVEDLVEEHDMTYIEAMLFYCDENDIEFEDIKKILSVNLKAKIQLDAEKAGYMKATARLPL